MEKEYSGLALNELRELHQLGEENAKLKRLVVDLSLDRHILQACELAHWTQAAFALSSQRVAEPMMLSRFVSTVGTAITLTRRRVAHTYHGALVLL